MLKWQQEQLQGQEALCQTSPLHFQISNKHLQQAHPSSEDSMRNSNSSIAWKIKAGPPSPGAQPPALHRSCPRSQGGPPPASSSSSDGL